MQHLTRRRALIGALAASLSGPVWAQQLTADKDAIDAATLAAYLDVLLPADAHSPAASALGIERDIIQFAQQLALFSRLLSLGTQWLNQTGRGAFHNLPLSDQAKVVDWMATADRDQIPGRFYHLVRLTAVEFYYDRPAAQGGFDLNPSPQPAGYPPPWQ